MRKPRFSLMARVLAILAVVGLLPLVVLFLQSSSMADALREQSQKTHLATVKAVADRVSAELAVWRALGEAAAASPALYADPTSPAAGEALRGVLEARPEVLAAGVYLMSGDEAQVVQQAVRRLEGESEASMPHLMDGATWRADDTPQGLRVRLRLPVPGRPALVLMMVSLLEGADLLLRPDEDEGQEPMDLVLADGQGRRLAGYIPSLDVLPVGLVEAAASEHVGAGAGEYPSEDGSTVVAGYSDVEGSDWVLFSSQPEDRAKAAAVAHQRFGLQLFAAVIALVSLLSVLAFRTVILPLRRIIRGQRKLAGVGTGPVEEGSEIRQLEQAFTKLQQHLHDREALSKVFLGRFQVVETLGVGAMGTVFKGFDPKLQRPVALKTFKLDSPMAQGDREQLGQRLVQEAVTLARLKHPNIVTVYDILDDGSAAFIAMELVEGVSLEGYLRQEDYLQPGQTIALGVLLLEALQEAHQHGVVHHDVKPANILLGSNGSVKVTDFGIAEVLSNAHRAKDVVCGTPGYLPPETLMGKGYTEKSDLFAAGVVLYQCLTGSRPFDGRNPKEVMVETLIGQATPPRRIQPAIPEALEVLVLALLDADPAKRPADAATAAQELGQIVPGDDAVWNPKPFGHAMQETPADDPSLHAALLPTQQLRAR